MRLRDRDFTFALCSSECVLKKCGPTSFPHWMFGRTVRMLMFGRTVRTQLAMRLKLSRQIPRRAASPTTSQVTKRGFADLARHNLLAIPHRELEHHQIGIIPNGLFTRQRHEPGYFPMAR